MSERHWRDSGFSMQRRFRDSFWNAASRLGASKTRNEVLGIITVAFVLYSVIRPQRYNAVAVRAAVATSRTLDGLLTGLTGSRGMPLLPDASLQRGRSRKRFGNLRRKVLVVTHERAN